MSKLLVTLKFSNCITIYNCITSYHCNNNYNYYIACIISEKCFNLYLLFIFNKNFIISYDLSFLFINI